MSLRTHLALLLCAIALGALCAHAQQTPPPVCFVTQLEPFTEEPSCGSMQCDTPLEVRNTSATACTLPVRIFVTALDAKNRLMSRRILGNNDADSAPLVLKPGDMAYYNTHESHNEDTAPHPPASAWFLLHFRSDDPGSLRFPGDQEFLAGANSLANEDQPMPDLSHEPRQRSGAFTFSAFLWPVPDPKQSPASAELELGDANDEASFHVSVANSGVSSPGWAHCSIVVQITEDGGSGALKTTTPCRWNGDLASGTIAAGATVAMEISRKMPPICHRAHYTEQISLEGAPVSFMPIILHTGMRQPVCSDSKTIESPVPAPQIPEGFVVHRTDGDLPVDGIRIGLEVPVRRLYEDVIPFDKPGDPVVAAIWIDNGRDVPLHLAGPHGFHLRVIDANPPAGTTHRPLELPPRDGQSETGPIDITIPPHTFMRVASVDIGANYSLVPHGQKQLYILDVRPDALTGEAARWNWTNDSQDIWSLHTLFSLSMESASAAH